MVIYFSIAIYEKYVELKLIKKNINIIILKENEKSN